MKHSSNATANTFQLASSNANASMFQETLESSKAFKDSLNLKSPQWWSGLHVRRASH